MTVATLRDKAAQLGPATITVIVIGVFLVLVAAFPTFFVSADPTAISPDEILLGPSWAHPLGTDEAGTDLLAKVVQALRLELVISGGSVFIATLIGVPLGLVAGLRRGWVDAVVRSFAEGTIAFPLILFSVLIVASFGASMTTLTGVLAFAFIPRIILLIRGEAIRLTDADFVVAGRALGLSTYRIALRHVLPNTIGPLLVIIPQLMAIAILIEAGLSYLGLGIQPPQVTWGTMLLVSKNYASRAPHYALVSGSVVTLAAAYLMFAGDLAAQWANPLRRRT